MHSLVAFAIMLQSTTFYHSIIIIFFFKVFSNISDDMLNTVQMLLELISIRSVQFRFSYASISKFDANISLTGWLSTK